MMSTVSRAMVRRSLDRSDHRKPLRVQITRRRIGKPAEAPPSGAADNSRPAHQFVTQVRFGGADAVVVPWKLTAGAAGAHPPVEVGA